MGKMKYPIKLTCRCHSDERKNLEEGVRWCNEFLGIRNEI
jgi:hypothetical protein